MSDFIDNTTVIEVEEKPMNASSISTNRHDELENLHSPNQHTIGAITGLSSRLENIESLKQNEAAKGKGYAEYWSWSNDDGTEPKGVGYFVSLVQRDDNNMYIKIADQDGPQIFGVTIPKNTTAFIGNEEWEPIIDQTTKAITGYESTRDASYDLVCLVGAAKVRYGSDTLNINAGDYVKPGNDGRAVKAANNEGLYRVVSTGYNDTYGYYVEINLSISASDVENISVKHAKSADNYTNNGTIKTAFDNLENGATVVHHAENADCVLIEDVNAKTLKPYNIKTCTKEALKNVEGISDAIYITSDNQDYYYYLDTRDEYMITSGNLNDYGVDKVGVYEITNRFGDIVNLPFSNTVDMSYIKLIVERQRQNEITYVRQTIHAHLGFNEMYPNTYIRLGKLETDNTYIWGSWETTFTRRDFNSSTINKAKCDEDGNNIAHNYYYLGAREGFHNSKYIINSGEDLDDYGASKVGVYEFCNASGDIWNLPVPTTNGFSYLKLIVECQYQHNATYVKQTVYGHYSKDYDDAQSSVKYTRVGELQSSGKYEWSDWEEAMTRGKFDTYVVNANNTYAKKSDIENTYAKKSDIESIDTQISNSVKKGDLIDPWNDRGGIKTPYYTIDYHAEWCYFKLGAICMMRSGDNSNITSKIKVGNIIESGMSLGDDVNLGIIINGSEKWDTFPYLFYGTYNLLEEEEFINMYGKWLVLCKINDVDFLIQRVY